MMNTLKNLIHGNGQFLKIQSAANILGNHVQRKLHAADAVTELKNKGYDCDIHSVTTEDGYILELHRMKKESVERNPNYPPLLFHHGIWCSSVDYLALTKGICYSLFDLGCDVWLANSRGNAYSRKHSYLDVKSEDYWNFSFHEMGVYDTPACINHICRETKSSSVICIGHSQGTTQLFALLSTRPEYNSKVKSFIALAPVAGLFEMKRRLFKVLAMFTDPLKLLTGSLGVHASYISEEKTIKKLENQKKTLDLVGRAVTNSMCNYASEELLERAGSLFFSMLLNGNSLNQLLHFGQSVDKKYWFHQMNRGVENVRLYGQEAPPPYSLENITTPVTLIWGKADWFTTTNDLTRLYNSLTCEKKLITMPLPEFNHLDMIWSPYGVENIVRIIMADVKRIEKSK